MNPDVQKNLKKIAIAAGIILLFMLLSLFTIWLQKRDIERNIDRRFDRFSQPTLNITKYDSSTEAKLDSISVSRQIAHKRIDDLHDSALQLALDSAFNNAK